jgi:glycosyltransferase involved in cell wall biosynthesis
MSIRVCLLQTQAENAGAQEISRLVGDELSARGFTVKHVFLFRRTAGFDGRADAVFCAPGRPRSVPEVLRLFRNLHRVLRDERPDVVLCFQHWGNLVGALFARLARAGRVVANQNSAVLTTPTLARRLDRLAGTFGLYDAIVVNSADTASGFAGYPEAYRRRMSRIDHGFECKTSALDRPAARAALGLPPDGPLLGCVARLHPLKHLDAAIRLLPHDPSWRLALAGQGADEARLRALAADLGCGERVHFLGELSQREIGTVLRALDVFAFPSLAESFGLAAVEAAQAGVPVVANDLPVLREVLSVDGGSCALFADARDDVAFAQAVRRALGDADLRAALAARGARLARRYSLAAMADAYAALARSLAERRRGAAPPETREPIHES